MRLFDRLRKKGTVDSPAALPVPAAAKTTTKKTVASEVKPTATSLHRAPEQLAHTVSGRALHTAQRTLLRPVISEKSAHMREFNQYVFEVHPRANKSEVAKAVVAVYSITPLNVRIMNASGKTVVRGRVRGRTGNYKKAIVTLPKGKSIPIFEGV